MKRFSVLAITSVVLFMSATFCLGDDSIQSPKLKLKPSGFAEFEFLQVAKGGYDLRSDRIMDGLATQLLRTGIRVDATLSDKNLLFLELQMQMYNDFPRSGAAVTSRYLNMYPYLHQAEYIHSFGDVENPYLKIGAGYFPFKYNPDARNLGEYLFRSGTYPQYLITNFDWAQSRLLGLDATYTAIKNLKIDALLFTNLEYYAVGDWNLGLIASYRIADMLEIGLGGTINSLISEDNLGTTPTQDNQTYVEGNDTLPYTFKGEKLMARVSLDLKKIIKCSKFGKEDLKIYGEADIIGLKNYSKSTTSRLDYTEISERIPIAFGLNIPCFKFLDVLSVEGEWFGNRYPNQMGSVVIGGVPLVGTGKGGANYSPYDPKYMNDDWKWSIYTKKALYSNYSITAQIASDHWRTISRNFNEMDWEEKLNKTSDWYYTFKVNASF